jgi:hypothetical protein
VPEGATREDFNGRTNARLLRRLSPNGFTDGVSPDEGPDAPTSKKAPAVTVEGVGRVSTDAQSESNVVTTTCNTPRHPTVLEEDRKVLAFKRLNKL